MKRENENVLAKTYVWISNIVAAIFVILLVLPTFFSIRLKVFGNFDADYESILIRLFAVLPFSVILIALIGRSLSHSIAALANKKLLPRSHILHVLMYGYLSGRPEASITDRSFKTITGRTPAKLVFLATIAAFVGTQSIDAMVQLGLGIEVLAPIAVTNIKIFFLVALPLVFLFPFIESIVMTLLMELAIRHIRLPTHALLIVFALGWAIAHGLANHPIQAISISWLFFILGWLYIELRQLTTLPKVFFLVFIAHAANNLLALLLIFAKQAIHGT